ncbi:MAG: SigB/SigF/SigG family RNA polymerase sigma factor [Ilumatobacteraceae bacterium]
MAGTDVSAPDTGPLFVEFARTGRRRVRNQIVEAHMGLAVHIAKRYNARAGRDDDIEQVAMLALVKAVDRFDHTMGVPFASFAGRTIEGEIKRHFRDATWAIKVPRSAKELHLAVRRANEELSSTLGRSPSVAEVAEHLHVDRDDVITGLAAGEARQVGSIDPKHNDDDRTPNDRLTATSVGERGYGDVENATVIERLLATLPAREQEIVRLRFYEERSQVDIAEAVGVSQMHVSRLLRSAFERLRQEYVGDDPDAEDLLGD